jgi:hypothetical protein
LSKNIAISPIEMMPIMLYNGFRKEGIVL